MDPQTPSDPKLIFQVRQQVLRPQSLDAIRHLEIQPWVGNYSRIRLESLVVAYYYVKTEFLAGPLLVNLSEIGFGVLGSPGSHF